MDGALVGAGSNNCLFPRSDKWWSSGPTLCQFYLCCESTVRNTPMMLKEWGECWLHFGTSQCRPIITWAWWNGISPFQGQYANSCPAMHTYIEVFCDSDIAQHVGSHRYGSLKQFLSFIFDPRETLLEPFFGGKFEFGYGLIVEPRNVKTWNHHIQHLELMVTEW